MISEDNTFVDLTNILNENNRNNKNNKNNRNNRNNRNNIKCLKCKMPQFLKDLLNLVIPTSVVIGIITLICLLV